MDHLNFPYLGKVYTDRLPELSDQWVVSAPIRIVQHLANVWHLLEPKAFQRDGVHYRKDGHNVFAPMDTDHPWTQWAAKSHENYGWLYYYAEDIVENYKSRFISGPVPGKHGIFTMLSVLDAMPESVPEDGFSEPDFKTEELTWVP